MSLYRRIWEEHHGPIPVDTEGRSFHIHHKDGDHSNNDISNLECLSAWDHYERHLEQGDLFAAYVLARHLKIELQPGEKHPGFGKPRPQTVKEKIASKLRGSKHTPERKAKIGASQLGKKRQPYKSYVCPHCGETKNHRTHVDRCQSLKWSGTV